MMIFVVNLSFSILTIAVLMGLYRLAKGPTVLDRVMAFDLVATCIVGMIILLSIRWRTSMYLELIIIFCLLGFLTTVAYVIYLHKTTGIPEKEDSDSTKFNPPS